MDKLDKTTNVMTYMQCLINNLNHPSSISNCHTPTSTNHSHDTVLSPGLNRGEPSRSSLLIDNHMASPTSPALPQYQIPIVRVSIPHASRDENPRAYEPCYLTASNQASAAQPGALLDRLSSRSKVALRLFTVTAHRSYEMGVQGVPQPQSYRGPPHDA